MTAPSSIACRTLSVVVFVGTVVGSRLIRPLSELQAGNPRDQPGARLEVEPQIVLKGSPASIPEILAGTEYSDPRLGRIWGFPETEGLAPGETVLVVGQSGESVVVGVDDCSASRRWDAETAKAVRAMFPSVP